MFKLTCTSLLTLCCFYCSPCLYDYGGSYHNGGEISQTGLCRSTKGIYILIYPTKRTVQGKPCFPIVIQWKEIEHALEASSTMMATINS